MGKLWLAGARTVRRVSATVLIVRKGGGERNASYQHFDRIFVFRGEHTYEMEWAGVDDDAVEEDAAHYRFEPTGLLSISFCSQNSKQKHDELIAEHVG